MSRGGSLGIAAAAAVALATTLAIGDPGRAWAALVANIVFWIGLAGGTVTLAAVLTLSNARWAGAVQREAATWTRPLLTASLLLVAVPLGATHLYEWARAPVSGLERWLSPELLFGRDLLAAGALWAVAAAFARATDSRRRPLAVALILAYTGVATLLAWDLIMSLEPRWTNTLFGAYTFIGGAYAALAMLVIRTRDRADLTDDGRLDLGTLLFGFCMLWSYFLWSQYLVIWYGNLPRESGFWVARSSGGWEWMGLAVLVCAGVAPFLLLLSRELKRHLGRLAGVGAMVLLGLWLERLLLFLPAVADDAFVGLEELLVSVAVAALVTRTRAAR